MNIESIVQPPKDLQIARHLDDLAEDSPQLLELRTESGSVYVRPSSWQRLRLLWTFRHFHVLPPQVLSRRDRQLIEELSRSAHVSLPPPAASTIIGVVEMARNLGSTENARPGRRTQGARPQALRERPLVLVAKPSAKEFGPIPIKPATAVRRESGRRSRRFQQWGALGTLAALGIVVILARFYGFSLLPKTSTRSEPPAVSQPVRQAAAALPVAPPPAAQRAAGEKPTRKVAVRASAPALVAQRPAPPAVVEPLLTDSGSGPVSAISAAMAPSAAAERLFVSELPQGNFARPVVSDLDPVGDVELKALIGADGSVEAVSLVSGNPKLAQAGSRAVRHWHYSQEQGLGREAEALIRMSFFGPDAISVTSLAR